MLSFLLIFKRNMEQTQKLETKNIELSGQIDTLSNLQIQVNKMKMTSEKKLQDIEKYTQEFPCKMTQQKVISNLFHLWKDSGMELRTIKPGGEQTFFKNGEFLALSSEEEGGTEAQDTEISEVEKNPEKKVPLNQMVGKVSSYELEVSGSRKQILKAFDWISQNPEHMSLSNISLSFDASTGDLTGTIGVNFYCLNGNGVSYVEPDISGIVLGNKDVFGTFKKK